MDNWLRKKSHDKNGKKAHTSMGSQIQYETGVTILSMNLTVRNESPFHNDMMEKDKKNNKKNNDKNFLILL